MDGTIIGNSQKPLPLDLGQITHKGNFLFDSVHDSFFAIAVAAICRVDSGKCQPHVYSLKRPASPLRIHPDSHAGAGSQGSHHQFVRVGSGVGASGLGGFVSPELVRPDGYILHIRQWAGID